MTNEIYLNRIRFEHFYNGVLTFDIVICNYDCLFCFSKEFRYNLKDNIKRRNIHEIKLENLSYINGKIISSVASDKQYLNENFGKNEEENNLIMDKNIRGECVISTNINIFIKQLKELFLVIKPKIHQMRFTGGEVTCKEFLSWLNKFITNYYETIKGDLDLIIETNGHRFKEDTTEKDYRAFINILLNKKYNKRIHVRISLKNPRDVFYEVLTKYGTREYLDNAIDFGIFCYLNGINFHYTFLANYLSVDDLILFKKKMQEKLENKGITDLDKQLEVFFDIFRKIEFERLFHYPILFKEYILADHILGKKRIKEEDLKLLEKDKNFKHIYTSVEEKFKNQKIFTNKHKAYYTRFYFRSLPTFKNDINKNIFINDIIQYKRLIELYSLTYDKLPDFKSRVKTLLKVDESIFENYEGIQKFWELAFRSRYLLENILNDELGKEITFKNISILNRIPLYPGMFYLRDFWNQANPDFFVYTLYSERKYIDKNNLFSIFSINSNPKSHAHTDISRAIPVLIEKKDYSSLIEDLDNNQVTNFDEIKVKVINISNYRVKYDKFNIIVPIYILKLEEVGKIEKFRTPFLGSVGGLYKNYFLNKKYDNLYYLNYFIWTGIKDKLAYKASVLKAYDYLFNKYEYISINENNSEKKERWLKMKYIEPVDDVLSEMGLIDDFTKIKADDTLKIKDFIMKISTKIDEKIRTQVLKND